MIQLSVRDYSIILPFLTDLTPLSTPIHGILEGKINGSIWVDSIDSPSVVFVNTGNLFSYLFVVNELNEAIVSEILAIIKHNPVMYMYAEQKVADYFMKIRGLGGLCEFSEFSINHSVIQNIDLDFSSDIMHIERINKENFHDCLWYKLLGEIFGGVHKFLENGLGFVIRDDVSGEVVSEAYSGYVSANSFEVAVNTNEKYRQKGYAKIVCEKLIASMYEKGYKPRWSCESQNIASNSLAKKLGFTCVNKPKLIKFM